MRNAVNEKFDSDIIKYDEALPMVTPVTSDTMIPRAALTAASIFMTFAIFLPDSLSATEDSDAPMSVG